MLLVTAGADFVGHNRNGHHSSHNSQVKKMAKCFYRKVQFFFYFQASRQGRQDDGAVQVGGV